LYKYVENTLIDHFSDFIKRLKEINEDKINKPQKGLFKENSNLVFQFLKSKMEENSKVINSTGEILSEILENFDTEMDKYYKYEAEEDSRIELNQVKKYDIFSEIEMLQKFVDSHSTEHKTFIYEKFHTIIKTSRLCKSCKKCTYNYQSFPTLKIPLNRSNSLITDNQLDNEIYNALISKICFPENLSQLLSPSYNSIKKEHCENCKKYKEIIYNNSIFAVKQYLIVDIDRENDPKNEMIFIYPEILDFTKEDILTVDYVIENPDSLTGITFNEDAEDLICETLGRRIKRCEVPKSHFNGKESGYYFTKHTNLLDGKSFSYEAPPIKIILPE
jgi:hypothetical protein